MDLFNRVDNFTIIVSVGKNSSEIMTGILFEHILSCAYSTESCDSEKNFRGLYVRPEPIDRTPPRLRSRDGTAYANLNVLRNVELLYVSNRRNLFAYFTDISTFGVNNVDCLILENCQKFDSSMTSSADEQERVLDVSLLAYLQDFYLHNNFFSKTFGICPLLVTLNFDELRSSRFCSDEKNLHKTLKFYTPFVYFLVDDDGVDCGKSILKFRDSDKALYSFTFENNDNSFNVIKIE